MRFRGPLDTPSRLYTGRVGVSCLISFYCPHDILSYIFSFLLTFLNYVIVYHRRFFLYYIILYYIILSCRIVLRVAFGAIERSPSQCQHSVLNDATGRIVKNLPAQTWRPYWEAFHFENQRLIWTPTLQVPNRSPHPNFEIELLIKWFRPTRVETRTKESNINASSGVVKRAREVKVIAGIVVPATDQSIERGLIMSASVRTREMVNYAGEGLIQRKL